eukprot:s370_g2.t1
MVTDRICTIGRGDTCTIQLSDPTLANVSRVHCSFRNVRGRWWLCDEGSTNGTWSRLSRPGMLQWPLRVSANRGCALDPSAPQDIEPGEILLAGAKSRRGRTLPLVHPISCFVHPCRALLDREAVVELPSWTAERRFDGGLHKIQRANSPFRLQASPTSTFFWRGCPRPSHDTVAGRGIVICAGGPYLPLAWLSVRLLRKHCGCQLPVELWHLPNEVPDSWRILLDGESGVCLRELPELPRKRPEVWAVKPLALLGSSFAEILLLDADNLPLSSPDALFSESLYREHGAVFWKDFGIFQDIGPSQWLALSGGQWDARPSAVKWEHESGQLLLDKKRCSAPLHRAAKMAIHLGQLSPYLPGDGGDKDLFQLAWALENRPFGTCPKGPAAAGGRDARLPSRGRPCRTKRHACVG